MLGRGWMQLGFHGDGIKVADLYADPAADARCLVNEMRLPSFAADGVHWAVA